MTTVTASTSLILVTTSNNTGPYRVNFPNISTTGRIITVRDNDGFASTSNAIVLQAISGATFQGISGSLTINQPFGFITLNSQANGVYGILNTFAFPAGSTTANVSNVVASNVTANTLQTSTILVQSTVQIRDRATGVFNSLFASSGQLILNNSFVGQVSAADLTSTVTGLGTAGYLSTVPLFASTQLISSLQTNFLSAGAMTVGSFNPALINANLLITNVLSSGLTNISSLRTNARTIALGSNAGITQANNAAIAIGADTASLGTAQGSGAIAIGSAAGRNTQGTSAVAIGLSAGNSVQGNSAISIGDNAGNIAQGTAAIAIGPFAGQTNQLTYGIAIGATAGFTGQGTGAIGVGYRAGNTNQTQYATAVGYQAGNISQSEAAVALGVYAGETSQQTAAIAVGLLAGQTSQGLNATAIGREAGVTNQGANAVAIGAYAGSNNQSTNTIVLNATGAPLNTPASNAMYIKPIRQNLALNSNMGVLYYTSTTGELTYGPTLVSTFSTLRVNSTIQFPNADVKRRIVFWENANNDNQVVSIGKGPATMNFQNATTTDDFVFNAGTSATTSSELMRIKGTGSVGIGTSNPAYTLDVTGQQRIVAQGSTSLTAYGNNGASETLMLFSPCNAYQGGTASLFFGLNGTTNYPLARIVARDIAPPAAAYQSELLFQTNDLGTSMATRMIINRDGNVGIRTTSPVYTLDVNGSIRSRDTGADTQIIIEPQLGSYGAISAFTGSFGSRSLVLNKDGGNVGIGTTTPSSTLDINGSMRCFNGNNFFIAGPNGSGSGDTTSIELKGGAGGGAFIDIGVLPYDYNFRMAFFYGDSYAQLTSGNGANDILIAPNGGLGRVGINITPSYTLDVGGQIRTTNDSPLKPTAGQWSAYSDQRIKTNIQLADTTQCYEIMKAIDLYHYKYIDAFYSTNTVQDKSQLGFIAQNVSSIFPKAVSTIVDYGYNDLLILNPTQIQMAHYGATRKLMDTVEEQTAIIKDQQNAISTLISNYRYLIDKVSNIISSGF